MIFLNIKKIIYSLSFVLSGLVLLIFSLNLLFSQEQTQYTEIKGNIINKIVDLSLFLEENSILQDRIYETEGKASHYGKKFHNRKTASGEKYNMNNFSAAHRNFPFGTILKITNTVNNKSTFVKINDRGPFVRKRIIDLSYKSAELISGFGLPNIKIEGFIPEQPDFSLLNNDDYYFAYSYNYKPAIIPSQYLDFICAYYDFDSLMVNYNYMIDNDLIDSENAFIVFSNEYYNSYDRNNQVFYIAKWKPLSIPKIPVMMAEKIYINK